MPVFLLHGRKLSFLSALFFSILIVFVFGNKFVGDLFDKIFTGRWIGKGRWLWQERG